MPDWRHVKYEVEFHSLEMSGVGFAKVQRWCHSGSNKYRWTAWPRRKDAVEGVGATVEECIEAAERALGVTP